MQPLPDGNARPGRRSETGGKLADETATRLPRPTDAERARRRWRIQSIGRRRRISVALDQLCGLEVAPPGQVQIDYERCGLALGWAERVAAGRAGLGVAA